jgi:hypothetical protein
MDAPEYLEWLYRNTWLCTNCGERHSFTVNICPKLHPDGRPEWTGEQAQGPHPKPR